MKNIIRQIFHSSKFVAGFSILLFILLTIIIYPLIFPGDPLQMIGLSSFSKPGIYVSVFDAIDSETDTIKLPDADAKRLMKKLSNKDRVAIAISTILSPKVLIADEPSSALDVTSQKMVIKMLRNLMEKGYIKSMIFITHELPLLYNVTDDIMVMYAGQIVEKGTAKEMVFDPIHPYSKGLMGSIIVPEAGTRDIKLTAIPGTPPNLKKPPPGCRFAERCKYAFRECKINAVGLRDFEEGRSYRCLIEPARLREVYKDEQQ